MSEKEKLLAHALWRIANAALTDAGGISPPAPPRFPGISGFIRRIVWKRKLAAMTRFYRRGKLDAYERTRAIAVLALEAVGLDGNVIIVGGSNENHPDGSPWSH